MTAKNKQIKIFNKKAYWVEVNYFSKGEYGQNQTKAQKIYAFFFKYLMILYLFIWI